MQIQNSKFKIQSYFKKLFTVHCSLFTERGFTLIEILMIIVVVSIAIPALLILVGGEAGRGIEPELRITATNVAQQLMDEIMSKCWDETATTAANCGGIVSYSTLGIDALPVPEVGNDPTTYDDVDDYTAGVPAVTISGVSYSRSVQVCYVPVYPSNDLTTTDCRTTAGDGTNYKRIQVTVTAPANNWNSSVVLTTVMTNY